MLQNKKYVIDVVIFLINLTLICDDSSSKHPFDAVY